MVVPTRYKMNIYADFTTSKCDFRISSMFVQEPTDFNVPFKVFRFVHRFSCIILHIYGTNSLVLLGVNTSIAWAIEFSILAVC